MRDSIDTSLSHIATTPLLKGHWDGFAPDQGGALPPHVRLGSCASLARPEASLRCTNRLLARHRHEPAGSDRLLSADRANAVP